MRRSHPRYLTSIVATAAMTLLAAASMAEEPRAVDPAGASAAKPTPPSSTRKPMKMKEPMAGEMKKEGMAKGDVRKAAEEKEREMKPMMEKEEKSMKK
jgi:hypothetical protein